MSRALDARYVVEGRVRRIGKRRRTSARLIDGDLGSQRWSERLDRPLREFREMMDDIMRGIVRAVVAQIGLAKEARALRVARAAGPQELARRGDYEMRAFLRTWAVDRL